MKKIISIFVLTALMFAVSCGGANAQDRTLKGPSSGYFWGATTDSLLQSDSITYEIRIKGDHVFDINLGLYVTKESGTVTNNFIIYGSMDGTNWTSTGDTIANSNASTGMATYKDIDDWNYPYIMIRGESGATAQEANYKMYYIFRYE